MFVLKINADSFESPFNNKKLQCLVGFAKQPTQIPCILELKNFAFDPYVGRTENLRNLSALNLVLISYRELTIYCVLKLA